MSSYAQSIFIYVYDHLLDKISDAQTLKSKIGKNLFEKNVCICIQKICVYSYSILLLDTELRVILTTV